MTIGSISDSETAMNVKVINPQSINVTLTSPDDDDNAQALLTDDITGSLVILDAPHHEIHEGETFQVSYKSPDASPVGDNATVVFTLTVGANKTAHLIWDAACGGDFETEFYEGSTTTGGTNMTPQNKNRTFPNANTVTVVRDPTVSAAGTLLENIFAPGGTGPQASGSTSGGQRDEWILKKSTKYTIRLTNRSGGNQPVSLRAEWYEE